MSGFRKPDSIWQKVNLHLKSSPKPQPPQTYTWLNCFNSLTGYLIYLSIIFGPWAFGTVHTLAVWMMKRNQSISKTILDSFKNQLPTIRILMLATVGALSYIFIPALNARAIFDPQALRFIYSDSYIPWLPHSYNTPKSW